MTLALALPPALEAELHARIAARDAEGARRVLADALDPLVDSLLAAPEPPSPASKEDFDRSLDALAELGRGLPDFPDSAFTREAIYGDHP